MGRRARARSLASSRSLLPGNGTRSPGRTAARPGKTAGQPRQHGRAAGPDAGGELPPGRYLDREESWLHFSERVLELAEDENVPLLERVRFASIFASALDEFFMVRVAGRIRRMATGLPVENATGRPAREILEHTLETARDLSARHSWCFSRLDRAGPRAEEDRDPALEGAPAEGAGKPAEALPGADLPGAHPAGRRPSAPVSLHLRPVAQPGGDDRRSEDGGDDLREGQGAAAAAQVHDRVA